MQVVAFHNFATDAGQRKRPAIGKVSLVSFLVNSLNIGLLAVKGVIGIVV